MSRLGCVICSELLVEEGRDVSVTKCGHSFHAGCLLPWIEENSSCPTCRGQLRHLRDVTPKVYFSYHEETFCQASPKWPPDSILVNENCMLKEKCKKSKREKSELKNRIANLEGALHQASVISMSLESEAKRCSTEIKTLKSNLKKETSNVSSLAAENFKLRSSLNELTNFKVIMNGREDQVRELLASYGERNCDNRVVVQLGHYCAELKGQLQQVLTEKNKLSRHVNKLTVHNKELDNEIALLKCKHRREEIERTLQNKRRCVVSALPCEEGKKMVLTELKLPNRAKPSDDRVQLNELEHDEDLNSDIACSLPKPAKSSYNRGVPVTVPDLHRSSPKAEQFYKYQIFKKSGFCSAKFAQKPKSDECYNGFGGHSGPPDFPIRSLNKGPVFNTALNMMARENEVRKRISSPTDEVVDLDLFWESD